MLSLQEREARALRELRDTMRAQDKQRVENPERNRALENIWVVFAWQDYATRRYGKTRQFHVQFDTPRWVLAGFRRRRKRRKQQTMNRFFAKIRRRLGIDRDVELKLVDLNTVQKHLRRGAEWRDALLFTPPHRQVPGRPQMSEQIKLVPALKQKVRRFRKDVSVHFHKRKTKFIALGRNPWDRVPGQMYIGPMAAETAGEAAAELATLNSIYTETSIVPVEQLSKKMRNAMHRARKIHPGVRVLWPEPLALDRLLSMTAAQLRTCPQCERDCALWLRHAEKQVHRAVKRDLPASTIAHALAVLTFLHEPL